MKYFRPKTHEILQHYFWLTKAPDGIDNAYCPLPVLTVLRTLNSSVYFGHNNLAFFRAI